MLVLEEQDPDLSARLQEKNLARQYDLLTAFIEIGLTALARRARIMNRKITRQSQI
jgi:hypothetical protein